MARFTTTGGSGEGTPGAPGAPGADGTSFLWSDEFDGGTTYPLNYVVSYQGSSYIKVATGGSFPLPTDSDYWSLLAQKGKDSFFLGTWNSVTEFLAAYQGGPVGLADGDWWAFVKDNTNPNKIYVVREDPLSATGWVIDDNEHFVLPQGPQGEPGEQGVPGNAGAGFGIFYLGNYNPSSGYVPDIAVVRGSDGQLYLAKASGALGDPVGNTAQWEVWIPKGTNGTNGTNGADGADGANGADALWNYTGEYSGGASYAVGDIATYDGQLWYRVNSNGGNVGDTPSPGLWNLLAAKGADGSGSADIADFVFTEVDEYESSISLPGDKRIRIEAGADSDLYITAGDDIFIQTLGEGDDIHLNAADDIRFTTANDIIENATIRSWTMNSEGQLHLPGAGYIENPIASSGDGLGYDTLKLVPDANVDGAGDQYIIIDPTTPNHIHIRAGGVQDASTAELFLGAERTGVQVSDGTGTVTIRSKNSDQINVYANSNSTSNTEFVHATGANIQVGDTVRLYTGGDTYVVSVVTEEYPSEGFITITAPGLSFITGEAYIFSRSTGEGTWRFRDNEIEFPDNTTQTSAFFGGATGTFISQDNKTVTVQNGIITNIV